MVMVTYIEFVYIRGVCKGLIVEIFYTVDIAVILKLLAN